MARMIPDRKNAGVGKTDFVTISWRESSRAFATPLATAYGRIAGSKSLLLRLTAPDGRAGYGEAVCMDWFGGTKAKILTEARYRLEGDHSRAEILDPFLPPEIAFATSSALAMLEGVEPRPGKRPLARLLPSGPQALYEAGRRIKLGARCFKYKLRGAPDRTELGLLGMLFKTLRSVGGRLRLDANGSLPQEGAEDLLLALSKEAGRALDYVEQPFPVGEEDAMRRLMQVTGVPVALDESAIGPENLSRWIDWQGPLVVKPALCGSPSRLAERLDKRLFRSVLSSAFEGPIGLFGVMLAVGERRVEAMGLGVGVWPEGDPWGRCTEGSSIDALCRAKIDMEGIWNGAS
jgi:O-succinylbenzoate synthase